MEDYRELEIGEIIRSGDQFAEPTRDGKVDWILIEDGDSMVDQPMSKRFHPFRRQTDEMILSQKTAVIVGMKVYGGGFMSSLGLALTKADRSNTIRIYQTWTDDWTRYYKMGKSSLKQ